MEGVKNKEHSSRSTCMHIPLIFNLLIQLKPSSLYSIGPTHSLSTNSHTSQRRILWQPSTSYHLVPPPLSLFPLSLMSPSLLEIKLKLHRDGEERRRVWGGTKLDPCLPRSQGATSGSNNRCRFLRCLRVFGHHCVGSAPGQVAHGS